MTPIKNKSHLYIKGPIPYLWVYNANKINPNTGLIGICLWFYVGIHKGALEFKLDRNITILTCISRQSRQRCLKLLHDAELIILKNSPGSFPTVKILAEDYLDCGLVPEVRIPTRPFETKTFDALTKACSGTNFRKVHFPKQGYSPYQQIEFRFDENN